MKLLKKHLGALLKTNLPVVFYRAASDSLKVCLQMTPQIQTAPDIAAFMQQDGYVFAPFRVSARNPIYFIRRDQHFSYPAQAEELASLLQEMPKASVASYKQSDDRSTTKADYTKAFQSIMSDFAHHDLEKMVLSRTIRLNESLIDRVPELYEQMLSAYPEAYVFCVMIPGHFVWMGATPESLLHFNQGHVRTVALAATRAFSLENQDVARWSEKEVEEQQFVTRYICQALQQVGAHPIEVTPLATKQAGSLLHLYQAIQAPLLAKDLPEILSALHPTPAVCGVPKAAAMERIGRYENYQRSYYSGYLGRINSGEALDFYVNLRSICFEDTHSSLYVGGGITAASSLEEEWEETEKKAATILNIIQDDSGIKHR